MSTSATPADAGLQRERTSLAWRRLGLALAGLAASIPAVTWQKLGPWCLPASVLTLACAAVVLVAANMRFPQGAPAASGIYRGDGRLLLLVTLDAMAVALTGAAAVLWGAAGP